MPPGLSPSAEHCQGRARCPGTGHTIHHPDQGCPQPEQLLRQPPRDDAAPGHHLLHFELQGSRLPGATC